MIASLEELTIQDLVYVVTDATDMILDFLCKMLDCYFECHETQTIGCETAFPESSWGIPHLGFQWLS
jgi:hypothetical protein